MTDVLPVLSKFAEVFLTALAPVLATLVATWLVAKLRVAWAEFKEFQPDVAFHLEQAAEFAVYAAEQAKVGKLIEDKKVYALGVAEKYLAAKGFTVDLDLIAAAIEAAVLQEFNQPQLKS